MFGKGRNPDAEYKTDIDRGIANLIADDLNALIRIVRHVQVLKTIAFQRRD